MRARTRSSSRGNRRYAHPWRGHVGMPGIIADRQRPESAPKRPNHSECPRCGSHRVNWSLESGIVTRDMPTMTCVTCHEAWDHRDEESCKRCATYLLTRGRRLGHFKYPLRDDGKPVKVSVGLSLVIRSRQALKAANASASKSWEVTRV